MKSRNGPPVLTRCAEVTTRAEKPLSAIAAARLRAEAATKGVIIQNTTLDPLPAPSSPPAEQLVSEYEESEDEPEAAVTKRNLKLCNWQNNPKDIFVENESELSINLDKNTTISLVGHFDFTVSRGAVNINGANIGAVTRDGQKAQTYRAHVPATQPIFKIRGLDVKNHVLFSSCKEPTPFAKLNPLYEDLWNTGSKGERRRTFGIVCCIFHQAYCVHKTSYQNSIVTSEVQADNILRSPTRRTTPSKGLCRHIHVRKTGFVPWKIVPARPPSLSSPARLSQGSLHSADD